MNPEFSNTEKTDEQFMREALKIAGFAADAGEVPIGAIAVLDGKIIGKSGNLVEQKKSAFAHAEMLAMEEAAKMIGDWRLEGVTVYVTKEPCAMCAGAMVNARVARVVFGLQDPRSGCAGGALDITGFSGMLHQVQVTGGILEEECRCLIQEFFRKVRKK